eukprot:jgi/Mesvir1/29319/Mv01575-RA.1
MAAPVPKNIKLTYFDIKGRAEGARLALTIGNIPFQDVRVTREEFLAMKPNLPFGSLPTIEVDGQTFAQSNAILRYTGKLAGLYPEDPLLAMKADSILDGLEDVVGTLRPSMMEKDAEKKMELRKALFAPDGGMTRYVSGLSKLVAANNKEGYSVGDKMSIADLAIYNFVSTMKSGFLEGIPKDAIDAYAPLMAVHRAVGSHPKVEAWETALINNKK